MKAILQLTILITLISCSQKKTTDVGEHSTGSSLADLKVYPGLKVQLFASEPMFTNPTNMAIDARGRVWVCEAYNYRNQYNPKNPERKEGDRIVILEDTDGDGQADKSKVFYQGTDVNAALGISLLGDKIIVSCSPNVFVFTDADGDDVPDKKEIFFQGIHGLQHDHGMHTFVFGPDGQLYFNFGNEGKCLLTAAGDTVVDVRGRKVVTNGNPFREGMVMRCALDGSNVEVLAHNFRNNYEVAVDPFGTLWQSDNDDDGNKGTRINYVMEGGNFGYRDEMTGAYWASKRTNMEKEIPLRHWHLNDPGVVPNVLQTGAGSPCGITIYEGTLLPEIFRGQMVHAEAGGNVARAYPIEKDGAGYKASIVNILEGQKDQWFRPVDVAVAPDGSLFIADWYDPGVGGHQVGDLDRGRIYRVSPAANYEFDKMDSKSIEGAVKALLNPNPATRFYGWTSLNAMGKLAEPALAKIWKSEQPFQRAQALWLLSNLPNGDTYVKEGLADTNSDIVITALRISRTKTTDLFTVIDPLIHHPSPQIRREVILALRGNNSEQAANRWTELALQYDGKDRWYLEALGIGASGNDDLYFSQWKKKVGTRWNTPEGRDIIWRSRSKYALPLLGELIVASNEKEMLRYYRAFDFQKDISKQEVLSKLATQSKGAKVLYALKHMEVKGATITPPVRVALNKVLDEYKGKPEFVELVDRFRVTARTPDLLLQLIQLPDSVVGMESMRVIIDWGMVDLIQQIIQTKGKEEVQSVVKTVWPYMYKPEAQMLMEKIINDKGQDLDNRKLAIRTFAGPWQSEDRLVQLARENKIPEELQVAAAGVFQSAWRSSVREAGARYLKLPESKEGGSLPPIAELSEESGNAVDGKIVFTNTCSTCHQVNGEGVNFGPNLSEIGSKLSKEAMYTSILFPDQGISFGYEGYTFKMRNGTDAFGMITSETADKVEIRYMNTKQTLDPSMILSRKKLATSLMPSNLQSQMSKEELINLVEYLSSLKRPL